MVLDPPSPPGPLHPLSRVSRAPAPRLRQRQLESSVRWRESQYRVETMGVGAGQIAGELHSVTPQMARPLDGRTPSGCGRHRDPAGRGARGRTRSRRRALRATGCGGTRSAGRRRPRVRSHSATSTPPGCRLISARAATYGARSRGSSLPSANEPRSRSSTIRPTSRSVASRTVTSSAGTKAVTTGPGSGRRHVGAGPPRARPPRRDAVGLHS